MHSGHQRQQHHPQKQYGARELVRRVRVPCIAHYAAKCQGPIVSGVWVCTTFFVRLHLRSLGFFLFELGFADLPAAGTDTQRMGGAQLLLLHVGCVVGIVQKWLFPLCLR